MAIYKSSQRMVDYFKQEFNNNKCIIVKNMIVNNIPIKLVYSEGMTDEALVEKSISSRILEEKQFPKKNRIDFLIEQVISAGRIQKLDSKKAAVKAIGKGNIIVIVEGEESAIEVFLPKTAKRAVTEPPSSVVSAGPREGFTECLETNLNLVRKRLATSHLAIKALEIGRYSKTVVSVVHMEGIADEDVVKRVLDKLNTIDIDAIIDSNYLVSFLEKRKDSIFKQVGRSEKPDIIAAKLLEGRVAIFVNGSPMVLTVPFILFEDFQSPEDYYGKSFRATFIRIIRFFGVAVGILLPGVFVAIQLYHYRIVHIKFLITIINSSQKLPMGPLIETIFVILLFEVLTESNLRMPKHLSMAVSIVGAVILGQTAVNAGIVSAPTIMIIAISSITTYIVPEQSAQISFLRLATVLIGGLFNIFGILIFIMFLILYLNNFDSYGAPYLGPYAPFIKKDVKDGIIKDRITEFETRPESIPGKNSVRMNKTNKEDANDYNKKTDS